jgi:hypothetical protein
LKLACNLFSIVITGSKFTPNLASNLREEFRAGLPRKKSAKRKINHSDEVMHWTEILASESQSLITCTNTWEIEKTHNHSQRKTNMLIII